MNTEDVRKLRMQTQRLIGPRFDRPEEMVRWLGAVQAQDYPGAKWGVAQRCEHVTDADIDRLFDAGVFLRTHVMRPTWHFVMPEDIRWMQALTAHRVHAMSRSRCRELEIDEAVATKAKTLFANALEGGNHLTRAELGEVLQRGGIEANGQRLGYLAMWAELDAIICSGARKGKQQTYALLDERAPSARELHPEEALAELTRRYFTSHGPATPHDFSWWSGLTVTEARRGISLIQEELASESIDGTIWWFVAPASAPEFEPPLLHLLPNYDEYFIGFRNREPTLNPDIPNWFDPKSEFWLAHFVARNGVIEGAWRRKLGKHDIRITTMLPLGLTATEHEAFIAATEAYGRFLGLEVALETA